MARAVLITGANLGDTAAVLAQARRLIAERIGVVTRQSGVYLSEPWGEVKGIGEVQPAAFMNQVLETETALGPFELLGATQAIEELLGRRKERAVPAGKRIYDSRTIDIDILFYGESVMVSQTLTLPHPLLHLRKFVLTPLAEVLPGLKHPVTGLTAARMADALEDNTDGGRT